MKLAISERDEATETAVQTSSMSSMVQEGMLKYPGEGRFPQDLGDLKRIAIS